MTIPGFKPLALVALGFIMVGCSHERVPLGTMKQSEVSASGYLDFYKTYEVGLSQNRILKVRTASYPWLGNHLAFHDTLIQDNGNLIDFDCNNIADKIIDKQLVEEVTPICDAVHQTSENYWKSIGYQPEEFTDNTGTTWKRVK